MKGRGADFNPPNRFERLHVEPFDDELDEPRPAPETQYLRMASKSILTQNESPDISFKYSINPYVGCTHGCAYCYARPYHEYWSLSAGLDFETRIFVKDDAPTLLRKELASRSYEPDVIAMSGVTDPYQPVEKQLKITRQCLEILNEFRNPVALITKNHLVTRDIDILSKMVKWNGAGVFLSITSLDPHLVGELEPRSSRPKARLEAISRLTEAGIPVGVNAQPMIPGLNDHEMPAIFETAAKAGARFAGYGVVRLPGAVEQLFEQWLETHRPLSRKKVMNRIRELHAGCANDSRFGTRMHGDGVLAEQIASLFSVSSRKAGLQDCSPRMFANHFRKPKEGQLDLFEA